MTRSSSRTTIGTVDSNTQDESRVLTSAFSSTLEAPPVAPRPTTNHFPSKLHKMLDDADTCGHAHLISWCDDGQGFQIHQSGIKELVPVLKTYFRQTKFKSFLRQLQGYNITRITRGNNRGRCSHPLLVRGQHSLCDKMRRKASSSSAWSSSGSMIPATSSSAATASQIDGIVPSSLQTQLGCSSEAVAACSAIATACKSALSAEEAESSSSTIVNNPEAYPPPMAVSAASSSLETIDDNNSTNNNTNTKTKMMGRIRPLSLAQMQSNFKAVAQEQDWSTTRIVNINKNKNSGNTTTPAPLPQRGGGVMNELRIEIGCTVSSSPASSADTEKTTSSLKRLHPSSSYQQVYQVSGVNLNSRSSAPTILLGQQQQESPLQQPSSKRHRSQEDGMVMSTEKSNSSSHKNSMFPSEATSSASSCNNKTKEKLFLDQRLFSIDGDIKFEDDLEDDPILTEEKMQFQKQQRPQQEQFEQLGSICFNTTKNYNNTMGNFDMSISLSTTTTNPSARNIDETGDYLINNKFMLLPPMFEPKPIGPSPSLIINNTSSSTDTTPNTVMKNSFTISKQGITQQQNVVIRPSTSATKSSSSAGAAAARHHQISARGGGGVVPSEASSSTTAAIEGLGITKGFATGKKQQKQKDEVTATGDDDGEDDWAKGIVYDGDAIDIFCDQDLDDHSPLPLTQQQPTNMLMPPPSNLSSFPQHAAEVHVQQQQQVVQVPKQVLHRSQFLCARPQQQVPTAVAQQHQHGRRVLPIAPKTTQQAQMQQQQQRRSSAPSSLAYKNQLQLQIERELQQRKQQHLLQAQVEQQRRQIEKEIQHRQQQQQLLQAQQQQPQRRHSMNHQFSLNHTQYDKNNTNPIISYLRR